MESIHGLMDTSIVDSFMMERKTAKDTGARNQAMRRAINIQASIRVMRNMDMVSLAGKQGHNTKETTIIMRNKDMEK